MAIFLVYQPPAGVVGQNPLAVRFVRDGLAPLALIMPAIWLAWHKMWWWLVVYLLIAIALVLFLDGPFAALAYPLSLLPGIYLLLEGSALIQRHIEHNGWRLSATLEAPNQAAAEVRYFHQDVDIWANGGSAMPAKLSTLSNPVRAPASFRSLPMHPAEAPMLGFSYEPQQRN